MFLLQPGQNSAFLGFDLVYLSNVEEDYLISVFGDEYLEYKKKVGRYIGKR